eukprot:CAMPEP_0170472886 /NCGR_PEP_ID=MMETSP0123-20130129/14863_1 /TAXON_ID=182087 /ORGANISM="Favella ehrenbergii, Strain Fehren 1" /LENGTH=72 /DNA_ID=CAMNT_0010741497 /DNA_START=137 /DNA_END=352 /DNA_ORIENTATION=-
MKVEEAPAEEESKTVMINTMGEETKYEDGDESFEILQLSNAEDTKQEKAFRNLDQRDLELEILSNIDPNDEF